MSQIAYGTITITDTNDIESIVIEYARNQSSSSAPESGWSTDRPAWAQGYYIWQRTRTHKAGTDASKDTYGTAVCITGSTGATGATGQSLSSTKTQYTNVASNVTITTNNHTSYTWTDNVPAYNSSKPAYWARVTNTYTNPAKTEYLVYKDQGITDAIKTSNDANTIAGQAKTTANEAKEIAQQASADVTNLQTRTKYFWTNLVAKTGYPVGTYAASGIDGATFDYENSSTYGYNTLYSNGIKLRYNAINLGELTGTALTFYHPSTASQGAKAMELGATALKFYDATGSTAQAEFGGTQARVSGTINAYDGQIGNSSSNYWYIGNYTDYNQNQSAAIRSYGTAFIQLGDSNTWRLATNRFHSAWNDDSSGTAGQLHYPVYDSKYWDSGLHLPTSKTDKFLYIRNAPNTQTLENLQNDLEDSGYDYWTYQFYVDGEGNLHAGDIYSHGTLISGTSAPYLLKSGGTITGNLEVNGTLTKGSKNVAYLSTTPTNGQILIADGTGGGIKTSGYTIATSVPSGALFTDKNVQTSQANTTKIYLAGTPTAGTATGTLNYDSNVYLTTTAGTLYATTFDGTTFTGTAAKATNDADGNKISTTYLKLSGGTVSGEVEFESAVSVNDEFYADSITAGNLIVNGAGRFTNGLYGDLTGNVTGSITGNASTADKVNHNLVIKLASGTTEGTNMFTFNGAAAKTVDITKSALGLGNVENKSSATIRGELTSANVTTALGFTPYDSTNPNGYTSNVGTITGVTAGTGLNGGGTSGAVTLNHSNSITAQTTQGIYPIKIDAQGHISAYGSAPTTLSGYGITDAKIANGVITLGSNTITPLTSQWTANLYVGKTATDKANAAATNGNVYLNLVENNTVRNAHKITGSGTTTVTSDADGNITISSADSKTGTVTSITLTQGTGISIGSSGTAITTSGSRTISLADNYGDTKNPYANKTARYVLAAPADAAGAPSFRALTSADVGLGNVLNAAQVTGIGQGTDGKIRVYKGDSNYEDVAVEIVATESSSVASAQKLTSYGGSTKQPVYFPNSGTNAGKPVAIGYTIETSVPSGAVFTDTTYTFANGTNGFTVTPLNGTAQTVTVTPSITNNITGSGTSGYLAKFNGANTITSGPALGTDTTKFLNNKGEWAIPGGTYSLPLAANGTRGGVQIGFTTNATNRNYAVQLSSEKMYVNVPWTDTTYSAGTGLSLSGTTFNHSNSITAGTAGTSGATSSTNGTIAIPYVTYDAQGHITASGTHTHTLSSYPEAYLAWGGKNITADVTPIGASLSMEHNANRIAFLNPAAIQIEYTTNGGSNWVDSGYSDIEKMWLCTNNQNIAIGQSKLGYSQSTALTTNHWTRITLTGQNGTTQYVYTNPRKLLVNMSTAVNVNCLIEYKTGVSDAAWQTFGTYAVVGWSGWNDIPLVLSTFGGGTTQTYNNWYLRFTFKVSSTRTDNYKGMSTVTGLRLFGTNNWSSASNNNGKGVISSTGHLYSYDTNANASFPAQVTATQFNGLLSGNATSASSAPWSGITSKPTTISGYGITDAVLYGGVDTGLGSGTPAATAKTYYSNTAKVPTNSIKMFLNSSGTEYTTLFSNRGSYGSILKWGYNDKYIRILRRSGGNWLTDDWEKTSAGYADTAGSVNLLGYQALITTLEELNSFINSGTGIQTAKINAIEGHSGTLGKQDGIIISLPWNSGYGHQIYVDDNTYGIHHRYFSTSSGTGTWANWAKMIDSSNYTDYTVTKTGTGASGTWGISITGNAASATKATQDKNGNDITTKYVTVDTEQTITASQKTFTGATRWGTASKYGAVHYDNTLEALVFSFA